MGASIGLVIDGEVVPGEAGTYPVTNPVRPAEVVLDGPSASTAQIDRAVAAARRAAPGWAALSHAERAELVGKAAAAAGAVVGASDLARLLTREHGKVLWEAQFDAGTIGGMAGAFAPLAADALEPRSLTGGGRAPDDGGVRPLRRGGRRPALQLARLRSRQQAPAGAAHREHGGGQGAAHLPRCRAGGGRRLAEALPPGVVNAVNGPGPELGEALVAHPDVDMVSFTGGVPTGRAVMAGASAGLTPVVLELGGNDPAVIAPDVDIDDALASKIVEAAFITSGQVCMAIKRLYVPEDKVDAMVEALVARVGTEVVGDGLADEVTMGPVHRPQARDRVEAMLAQAEAAGARVHRPARVRDEDAGAGGYLVSPAIVDGASDDASIVCDEQFAPALPVLGYRSLDEAVERANATPFGLCASIWTADDAVADDVAERLQAGTVFVNAHGTSAMDHRAPFGGWKQSGYGVELGPEGMRAFTRPRTVLRFPPS